MRKISIINPKEFGYNFVDKKFLPRGADEYYLRNGQVKEKHVWRHLTFDEVEHLIKNGNSCTNWNDVFVEDPFNPALIKNSLFAGLVRICAIEENYLKYHDFTVPIGITNSKVISCDIGRNCAIHDCAYLSHYIIGSQVILSRIDEMCTTDHAKFGEGIVKDGESEATRVQIDVLNEAGGREVFPFVDMIPADAFLWTRFRDEKKLISALKKITQGQVDKRRGYYGTVGDDCVIKSCRIIKDVNFGDAVYVKGANKLKNLTVKSSFEEPSQIGEGVELVNGIIGFGCRVFYGVKAVKFLIGNNATLKYGARLIHSILGDNSTISCCEVLNTLLFPFHEQHHNNSFLISSMIQGQANMAAGATIGSNHNTRGNDGEIIAGRGFWPGLCVSLKHNSRFASFVLLSKADYPSELDIRFPFSMVLNNEHKNRLEIMPAYYWMYNMYSLERNNKKFATRDRRITKTQKIHTDFLAPDTASEIMVAMKILEADIEKAWYQEKKERVSADEIISKHFDEAQKIQVFAEGVERSSREVLLLKPFKAWQAYRQMLVWYGVKTLCLFFENTESRLSDMQKLKISKISFNWQNMGGQLMPEFRLDLLKEKIGNGKFKNWTEIHSEYEKIFLYYEQDNAKNAYAVLCWVAGVEKLTDKIWNDFLEESKSICEYIAEQIFFTKNKDYINSFRDITYRNKAERNAVLGNIKNNALIASAEDDAQKRIALLKKMKV
ncbi:MAG: DUF4954 domain-containing protein [Treponema sp.]|nr:MAG: DUF4954 domain-containing protein [Treponema sp.]